MSPAAAAPSAAARSGEPNKAPRPKLAKPKQPAGLVFVNISNPEDTRKSEYRTTIARTAMINRPRYDNTDTKTAAPASSSSSSSKASVPRLSSSSQKPRTTSTTSSNGRKSQVTSPDEIASTTTSPPVTNNLYGFGSPPELAHSVASPDSTDTSPPALTHYNSNGSTSSAGYGQPADVSYFNGYDISQVNSNGTANGYPTNDYYDNFDTSPPITSPHTQTGDFTIVEDLGDVVLDPNPVSKTAQKGKKTSRDDGTQANNQLVRAAKKTSRRLNNINAADVSQALPASVINYIMGNPTATGAMGGIMDPFDALPVKANAHTQELLYQYVNAYLMSPQLGARGSPVHKRLTDSRQKLWWPMIMRSKAALCALIVYVETTPDLPIKATSPEFLPKHANAALKAIRESLTVTNENQVTDDEICLAIVLLMIAAQRTNDKVATAAHAKGLADILQKRAEAFNRNRRLENATAEKGTKFIPPDNGTDPAARCLYCRASMNQETSERETSPEAAEPSLQQTVSNVGYGFGELIDNGILSVTMEPFIETSLKWNELASQAKRDRLSAACGASHAWTDGNIKDEAITPFDMAVMFAARIALYLSAWLDWNHSCAAVKGMVGAVCMSLRGIADMDTLITQCPDVILWATLLAGPYTEDPNMRQIMLKLAGRAAESSFTSGMFTFDEVVTHISTKFLWTSTMTPAARIFYNEGLALWQSENAYPAVLNTDDNLTLQPDMNESSAMYDANQGFTGMPMINGMTDGTAFSATDDLEQQQFMNMPSMHGYVSDDMILPLQQNVQNMNLHDGQMYDQYGNPCFYDSNGMPISYDPNFVMDNSQQYHNGMPMSWPQ